MSKFIQVSPNFKLDTDKFEVTSLDCEGTFGFGDKTLARSIYRDRMQGWFFEPVYELLDKDKYQDKYTVLAVSIVTPLIESLENYIKGRTPTTGKNSSSSFFKHGAKRIFFKDVDDNGAIDILYKGVRCGFAHEGFLKKGKDQRGNIIKCNIIITSQGEEKYPIAYDKNQEKMTIYAKGYVDKIQQEFKDYYKQLEEDKNELDKFFIVWEKQWKMKGDESQQISGTASSN